jgi:hypothetical protein
MNFKSLALGSIAAAMLCCVNFSRPAHCQETSQSVPLFATLSLDIREDWSDKRATGWDFSGWVFLDGEFFGKLPINQDVRLIPRNYELRVVVYKEASLGSGWYLKGFQTLKWTLRLRTGETLSFRLPNYRVAMVGFDIWR